MDYAKKRKQNENEESNSVTSPWSKRKANGKPLGGEETNPIVVMSDSNQTAGAKTNKAENDRNPTLFHQSFDNHVPLRCSCPYEGLSTRMSMLETVVLTIKQSMEELKDVVMKNVTPKRSTITEVKNIDDVLKRFSEEKGLFEKEMTGCKETRNNQSVRKLFSPEGKMNGNTSRDPIITTKTSMGNYKVTPTTNKEETRSNLIGPHIPKVIDLVATMLTHDEKLGIGRYANNWFLPSTFSQYVLTKDSPKEAMLKGFQKRFMGNADYISKIFLPIHVVEDIHWFLLIIDFDAKELVYLDSFQSPRTLDKRKTQIKKLTRFMEQWLMDSTFYDAGSSRGPKISEFKFAAPRGYGSQGQNSNDCAIWVIKWMMQKGDGGYKIKVDEGSRLEIALQLILHPYNRERDLMLKNATKCKITA
ncbi:ubiquitin-specific protease ESD4 [Trifolium repens]|nr:ubiquitin-specific protease ESD4 [Trifolium repens]